MITSKQLIETAKIAVDLAKQYKGAPHREMGLDGLLFGLLFARLGKIMRQHQIRSKAWKRPRRIDFRQWGRNPVVIEFAARTRGRNEHSPSQNRDELLKLTRQETCVRRYLLLLDVSGKPAIDKATLKAQYDKDKHKAGRGRYPRLPVTIVYAHPDLQHSFPWRPRKAKRK